MPRRRKPENSDFNVDRDEEWQRAWSNPDEMGAGKKRVLLNDLHHRIDSYRRRRRLYLIGGAMAAAVLVAVLVRMPGLTKFSPGGAEVKWREVASATAPLRMVLDDSSVVWLAPHSAVRLYPEFEKQRSMVLQAGTAFFDVTRHPEHAFTIGVDHQLVTVLGTAFSISRVDTADMQLTVKDGKVALDNRGGRVVLTENMQVRTLTGIAGSVASVEPGAADWWLEQQVRFHNISLEGLINRIEHYYQVKLSYGEIRKQMKITLTWDRAAPLKENLAVLNALTGYNIH